MLKSELEFEISVLGVDIEELELEELKCNDEEQLKILNNKLEIAYEEYQKLLIKYDNEDYEDDCVYQPTIMLEEDLYDTCYDI